MESEGFKRKLTAILSADIVGYSLHMREDEEATVRTLNEYKKRYLASSNGNKGSYKIKSVITYITLPIGHFSSDGSLKILSIEMSLQKMEEIS